MKHYQPLPTTISNTNHCQPQTNHYQPLPTTTNHYLHYQPLPTITNHKPTTTNHNSHYQLLPTTTNHKPTTTNHYQPLRTITNHNQPLPSECFIKYVYIYRTVKLGHIRDTGIRYIKHKQVVRLVICCLLQKTAFRNILGLIYVPAQPKLDKSTTVRR